MATPSPSAPPQRGKIAAVVAVGLSSLFPGLGQFYNRDIRKGIMFLIAGIITAFGPFLPSANGPPEGDAIAELGRLLLGILPFLAVVVWSCLDAYRARRR